MQYWLEFSTSNGKGQIFSVQTHPVQGESPDVLDDVLSAMAEAGPALQRIYEYLSTNAELETSVATKQIQALVASAKVSVGARKQLDTFVSQLYMRGELTTTNVEYVHHLVATAIVGMSTISRAINTGASDVQVGQSSYTEGIAVEIVCED